VSKERHHLSNLHLKELLALSRPILKSLAHWNLLLVLEVLLRALTLLETCYPTSRRCWHQRGRRAPFKSNTPDGRLRKG